MALSEESKRRFPTAAKMLEENPDLFKDENFYAPDDEQDDEEIDPAAGTMGIILNSPQKSEQ